jgi:N utilization substance protein A
MSKEILFAVEAMANEKGVPKGMIFEALEEALASAAKKEQGGDILTRVAINRNNGNFETFRRWQIVGDEDAIENIDAALAMFEIEKEHPHLKVGDFLEAPLPNPEFGRIAAQAARQVVIQKIRQAERMQVVEQFKDRVGDLVTGTIKRVERGNVFVDLGGNAEAIIPREKLIPREAMRVGDRVRGLLQEIRTDLRGPQLVISRTAPEFMIQLFKLEVPEVGQGLVTIMACARDPGDRAKIAVRANDHRTDPIGACIGMRGARVQAVTNELHGERVDIVLWNESPAQFAINAMAPAEVQSIVVDEEKHSMDIAVAEEKLSQAIGRGGQNVKLAEKLTGWKLAVMTTSQAAEKSEAEAKGARDLFMEKLQVDEEIAAILVQEGFSTIEEIAYVPANELANIEEFDADLVEELRARARDALLTQLIAQEEEVERNKPADDLLAVEGMDEQLAFALAARGVRSRDDLAELATDELMEVEGMEEARAKQLIMAARAHWFE